MTKRIIAIVFIFLCASVAWGILGGTIFSRTYDSGSLSSRRVASTWGTEQKQMPPFASFRSPLTWKEEALENGKKITKTMTKDVVTEVRWKAVASTSIWTSNTGRRGCCGTAPIKLRFQASIHSETQA